MVPAAAARLRAEYPGVELLLTEAEPQAALRLLRAGRWTSPWCSYSAGTGTPAAAGADEEDDGARARLLFDEPVHLVTQARRRARPATAGARLAGYAGHRWIAGCERCRAHLLWQCELAGFTPLIAFTTDDVLVAQALAAAGLGVALLPDLRCAPPVTRPSGPSRWPGPAATCWRSPTASRRTHPRSSTCSTRSPWPPPPSARRPGPGSPSDSGRSALPVGVAQAALEQLAARVAGHLVDEVDRLRPLHPGQPAVQRGEDAGR